MLSNFSFQAVLRCSRIMGWLQPQILRHFTALRPERKLWSFSLVVCVNRNSDSTTIFLRVQKFWKSSCIVFLFKGIRKSVSPLLFLGIRNSGSFPVLFGGSEILNILCCLGDQKFWISCVVLGVKNSESSPVLFGGSKILNLPCCLGVRNSEFPPVLFGGSEILNLHYCLGVRNSESSPLFLGDQKFWILSRIAWKNFIIPCKQGDVSCEF